MYTKALDKSEELKLKWHCMPTFWCFDTKIVMLFYASTHVLKSCVYLSPLSWNSGQLSVRLILYHALSAIFTNYCILIFHLQQHSVQTTITTIIREEQI